MFGFIGSVLGGVAGAIVGGPAGAAVGLSIGGSVGGGVDEYTTGMSNSSTARATAEYNAAANKAVSDYNADVYMATGEANAHNIMAVAGANASVTRQFADFSADLDEAVAIRNAEIIGLVTEYNATLNENEARYVLEEAEIQVDQTDKQVRQLIGKNRAYYAGAGVQLESGSPRDAEIDVRTQGDIDIAIIRRGAQIEAAKFQDAAAMGRWEGNLQQATTLWEGFAGGTLTRYQGELSAWQTETQGALNATTILTEATNRSNLARYQGEVNSMMTTYNGNVQADLFESSAQTSLFNGIVTGGTTAAMGYNWMQSSKAPSAASSVTGGTPRSYSSFYGPYSGGYVAPPQSGSVLSGATKSLESKYSLLAG